MFDGVHLGHQTVIESAVMAARGMGGTAGVLTFSPHPSRVLNPECPTRLLQPPRMKARALFDLGLEVVIWKRFTRKFASLPAEEFLPHLKEHLPGLRSVHVGEGFRFGRGRVGDVPCLIASAKSLGVSVYSTERLRHNGMPISSSRIREALLGGDLGLANRMLGRPYRSEGTARPGSALGRQMGFPTLNFPWFPELPPRFGVYCVRVSRLTAEGRSGPGWPGVANYGLRPTVGDRLHPVLEVHLLTVMEFEPSERVGVEWHEFLRPEKRFDSLAGLQQAIADDVRKAREWAAEGV